VTVLYDSVNVTSKYTWDAVTSVNLNIIYGQILTTPSCVYGRLFT